MQQLRPGDVVEVRSASEILETLDAEGALEALPFMPEMLHYVGRRFTVSKRVEKMCDTIAVTGSRRMPDVVYLEDLRCDGSAHGGCQAGCRIYWKEAWLRPVSGAADAPRSTVDGGSELDQRTRAGTRTIRDVNGQQEEVWRCQATEALKASRQVKTSDLRQYWRELRSGNHRLLRFVRVLVRGFFFEVGDRLGLIRPLPMRGPGKKLDPGNDLRPGDLVQVRPREEIAATLDVNGSTRGLSFDREMLPYCGGTYRVQDRVERLIDDRTGRMINIASDCLILEGVVCSGERSVGRWFCPRAIYPYWREAWLQRVDDVSSDHPHP